MSLDATTARKRDGFKENLSHDLFGIWLAEKGDLPSFGACGGGVGTVSVFSGVEMMTVEMLDVPNAAYLSGDVMRLYYISQTSDSRKSTAGHLTR